MAALPIHLLAGAGAGVGAGLRLTNIILDKFTDLTYSSHCEIK